MGRRANGEGTIYKRADGRWCSSISLPNGKRKYLYGKSRKEVVTKLSAAQQDVERGLPIPPERLKVKDFVACWLQDVAKPRVRQGTWENYEKAVRLYIIPELGEIKLKELQPLHIRELERGLANRGRSAMANHVHAVLRLALKQAARENLIARNPIDQMDSPRRPAPRVNYLSPEQIQHLLKAAEEDPFYAVYVLAVTTGMRIGEILGLCWADVQLEDAVLKVRQQVTQTRGGLTVSEPKTKAGRRIILLPRLAVQALKQHQDQQGRPTEGLIFHTSKGTAIYRTNFYKRSWYPVLDRAGIPRIRLHDLRHSAATLLLAEGIHPKVVAERLGHSRVSTTLDIYSHVLPGLQKEVANRLDALLEG